MRGGRSIPPADLAHYMLAVLGQPDTIGQVIGIATQQVGSVRQTAELTSAATGRCPLTCDDERDSGPRSPKLGQSQQVPGH